MLQLLITIVTGITAAGPLFLLASGLTLIYGVMRVLNFAHAAFFMVGVYVTVDLTGGELPGVWQFAAVGLATAVIVGVLGLLSERAVFRPLYSRSPEVTLLASFGLSLFLVGATERYWGTEPLTQALPEALAKPVPISSASISLYSLVQLGIGVVVLLGLIYVLRRTSFGAQALAVAEDREMAAVMGIKAKRVGAIVFLLGTALAGLAGAIIAPTVAVDVSLVPATLITVFAVVVMGGLGTIEGAALAAVAIGLVQSIATNYLPEVAPFAFIVVLALFLVVRPQGLLGRQQLSQEA
jgi:branched-subunit amino acid ABC-type transport system permease component